MVFGLGKKKVVRKLTQQELTTWENKFREDISTFVKEIVAYLNAQVSKQSKERGIKINTQGDYKIVAYEKSSLILSVEITPVVQNLPEKDRVDYSIVCHTQILQKEFNKAVYLGKGHKGSYVYTLEDLNKAKGVMSGEIQKRFIEFSVLW